MTLPHGIIPSPGEVWTCDFAGYVAPEMVKTRRVIILSPRNVDSRVVLVVPVSTTAPRQLLPVHVHIPAPSYRCFQHQEVWVKADLVAHVRLDRLDRVRIGGRFIHTEHISQEHLKQVRQAALHALGLGHLAPVV
jgi:uncharacterized protein YifN (PemK superfamily)